MNHHVLTKETKLEKIDWEVSEKYNMAKTQTKASTNDRYDWVISRLRFVCFMYFPHSHSIIHRCGYSRFRNFGNRDSNMGMQWWMPSGSGRITAVVVCGITVGREMRMSVVASCTAELWAWPIILHTLFHADICIESFLIKCVSMSVGVSCVISAYPKKTLVLS